MKTYVTSPSGVSKTARQLGFTRIKNENSKFVGNNKKTIINWGWENLPAEAEKCRVIINDPRKSKYSSNKLAFFRAYDPDTAGFEVVPWTESKEEAESWIDDGKLVVCRGELRGHSGEGIVLAETKEEIIDCQLYTKYIPKRNEYRVHVFSVGQDTYFTQRKARSSDVPDDEVDWRIRNHQNGFIFAFKEDHPVPKQVLVAAKKAVRFYGLDFGAVDIVWNERSSTAYVLEINTAPGLENTTLHFYQRKLNRLIEAYTY